MANPRALAWYHANKDRVNTEERREYSREYYQTNREKWRRSPEQQAKHNTKRRERYAADAEYREKKKSEVREYYKADPRRKKAQHLRQFNLTLEQYDAMFEAQHGACAICGYSDTSDPKFFPMVDHCHVTGRVRGLLCSNCNHALGKFKDSPERLRKAAEYLERQGE